MLDSWIAVLREEGMRCRKEGNRYVCRDRHTVVVIEVVK